MTKAVKKIDTRRWLPTPLTRSCLFYPIKNAVYLPHSEPIETDLYNGRILQKFVLLCPKHMRVMLWVLCYVEQQNNSEVWFPKKWIMGNYYGGINWTGRQYREMDKLISEITEAWFNLEYKFKGKTVKHYTHLMNYRELSDELKPEADNIISLRVNTFLLRHFLGGFITHLDDTLLARLKTQAAPIIYAFLSGQRPFYSGKRWVFKRDTLFKGIGMHTAARVKKWRPYRAKKFLESGLDELGAEGVLDKRIFYEDKKGTHYGWEYDKLRDSYALRKAPKKIKQPAQIAAEPIEVERTAQLARSMWAQSSLKQAHMHPSVFLNVAKRAIAFYEQYRHWLGYQPELGQGVTLVLSLSLICLERGNEPAGANWWAQAKFWGQELPYWLEDMSYMEQPSSRLIVSPEFYNRPGGEHRPAVPVGPFDAAPSPDDEDLY